MDTEVANRRLVELAERRHGVVALDHLRRERVPADWVQRQARKGRLRRLHRGVYLVAGRGVTRRGLWMAAVLACGEGAVLSHASAAALWQIRSPSPGPSHVTVRTEGGRARRQEIVVHRRNGLLPPELSERDGIPVTSPARTLLDLASTAISPRALERAADEAERLWRCTDADLRELVARHAGRPGSGRLRAMLDQHELGSTLTRLELEERFLLLCRDREIPQPLVNAEILGITPDFLWPRAGLVVEVDGRASHDTRRGFQDDRDRDSLLTASGYRVMRFTWWDVLRRPAVVAHRIAKALEGR
jgi:hypothetical protein